MKNNNRPTWLSDAIFYEIYPQSFCDSNSDGIGDINGIITKLDYIKELGCNAIWLNPCYVSPFGDAGYDISDYYTVAPRYGSNEDINGNYYGITHFKQYQGEKDFHVYQPVIFPILESRDITIGFENKIYKSNKKGINHGILSIEGGTKDAMLIVENLYDVSQQNKTVATYYRTASTGEREEVETGFYKNIVDGNG